eukprot:1151159-Pelagomonas_calceolata.AAC.4
MSQRCTAQQPTETCKLSDLHRNIKLSNLHRDMQAERPAQKREAQQPAQQPAQKRKAQQPAQQPAQRCTAQQPAQRCTAQRPAQRCTAQRPAQEMHSSATCTRDAQLSNPRQGTQPNDTHAQEVLRELVNDTHETVHMPANSHYRTCKDGFVHTSSQLDACWT